MSLDSDCTENNFEEDDLDVKLKLSADVANNLLPLLIIHGIFSASGIIGNLIVLYAYFFKYKRCTFRTFVLYLACIDLLRCGIVIPVQMHIFRTWFNATALVCKLRVYSEVVAVYSSSLLILLIAVERYRRSCKPFQKQMSVQVSSVLSLAILVFAALFSIGAPSFITSISKDYPLANNKTVEVNVCFYDGYYTDTKWFVFGSTLVYMSINSLALLCSALIYGVILFKYCRGFSVKILGSDKVFGSMKDHEADIAAKETLSTPEKYVETNGCSILLKTFSLADGGRKISTDSNSCKFKFETTIDSGHAVSSHNHTDTPSFQSEPFNPSSTRYAIVKTLKRKTIIMLTVSSVLIVTLTIYLATVNDIVSKYHLSECSRSVLTVNLVKTFFYKLYYVNGVIHPIVFGILDPRFRSALRRPKSDLARL